MFSKPRLYRRENETIHPTRSQGANKKKKKTMSNDDDVDEANFLNGIIPTLNSWIQWFHGLLFGDSDEITNPLPTSNFTQSNENHREFENCSVHTDIRFEFAPNTPQKIKNRIRGGISRAFIRYMNYIGSKDPRYDGGSTRTYELRNIDYVFSIDDFRSSLSECYDDADFESQVTIVFYFYVSTGEMETRIHVRFGE